MAPKRPDETERARTPIRKSAAGIRKQKPVPGPKLSTNAEDKTSSDLQNTITLLNQRHSPFLRLPAELRNRIYEYYFEKRVVSLDRSQGKTSVDVDWLDTMYPFSNRPPMYLSIVYVCRQIHTETALYPYTKFSFELDAHTNMEVGEWIQERSQVQKEAIKRLCVFGCTIVDTDTTGQGLYCLRDLTALEHVLLDIEYPSSVQNSRNEREKWKSGYVEFFQRLFRDRHLKVVCYPGWGERDSCEFRLDFDVKSTSP